jgi:hypothetical protein
MTITCRVKAVRISVMLMDGFSVDGNSAGMFQEVTSDPGVFSYPQLSKEYHGGLQGAELRASCMCDTGMDITCPLKN